jgi:Zn ribbon nucleic-acid-binding protein
MTQTECPKCKSSKIQSFLKYESEELIQVKECVNCNFEWEWKEGLK